ncbi:DUF397 domain-containing protein [Actinophytocola sediminis]
MSTTDRRDGWRKSSFSDQGNGCVEIACTLGAVRDSKNPNGPRLSLDVRSLVTTAKGGPFQG